MTTVQAPVNKPIEKKTAAPATAPKAENKAPEAKQDKPDIGEVVKTVVKESVTTVKDAAKNFLQKAGETVKKVVEEVKKGVDSDPKNDKDSQLSQTTATIKKTAESVAHTATEKLKATKEEAKKVVQEQVKQIKEATKPVTNAAKPVGTAPTGAEVSSQKSSNPIATVVKTAKEFGKEVLKGINSDPKDNNDSPIAETTSAVVQQVQDTGKKLLTAATTKAREVANSSTFTEVAKVAQNITGNVEDVIQSTANTASTFLTSEIPKTLAQLPDSNPTHDAPTVDGATAVATAAKPAPASQPLAASQQPVALNTPLTHTQVSNAATTTSTPAGISKKLQQQIDSARAALVAERVEYQGVDNGHGFIAHGLDRALNSLNEENDSLVTDAATAVSETVSSWVPSFIQDAVASAADQATGLVASGISAVTGESQQETRKKLEANAATAGTAVLGAGDSIINVYRRTGELIADNLGYDTDATAAQTQNRLNQTYEQNIQEITTQVRNGTLSEADAKKALENLQRNISNEAENHEETVDDLVTTAETAAAVTAGVVVTAATGGVGAGVLLAAGAAGGLSALAVEKADDYSSASTTDDALSTQDAKVAFDGAVNGLRGGVGVEVAKAAISTVGNTAYDTGGDLSAIAFQASEQVNSAIVGGVVGDLAEETIEALANRYLPGGSVVAKIVTDALPETLALGVQTVVNTAQEDFLQTGSVDLVHLAESAGESLLTNGIRLAGGSIIGQATTGVTNAIGEITDETVEGLIEGFLGNWFDPPMNAQA